MRRMIALALGGCLTLLAVGGPASASSGSQSAPYAGDAHDVNQCAEPVTGTTTAASGALAGSGAVNASSTARSMLPVGAFTPIRPIDFLPGGAPPSLGFIPNPSLECGLGSDARSFGVVVASFPITGLTPNVSTITATATISVASASATGANTGLSIPFLTGLFSSVSATAYIVFVPTGINCSPFPSLGGDCEKLPRSTPFRYVASTGGPTTLGSVSISGTIAAVAPDGNLLVVAGLYSDARTTGSAHAESAGDGTVSSIAFSTT